MKIIEALKGIKVLRKKQDDLVHKISINSALLDFQDPPYGSVEEQKEAIAKWLQQVQDLGRPRLKARFRRRSTSISTCCSTWQ